MTEPILNIEESKARQLLSILGRKNPSMDLVVKVKNVILQENSAENILEKTLEVLMYKFSLKFTIKENALNYINKIKKLKKEIKKDFLLEIEKPQIIKRFNGSYKNLQMKEQIKKELDLIKLMLKKNIPYTVIYKSLKFDFSYETFKKVVREIIGV